MKDRWARSGNTGCFKYEVTVAELKATVNPKIPDKFIEVIHGRPFHVQSGVFDRDFISVPPSSVSVINVAACSNQKGHQKPYVDYALVLEAEVC